MKPLSGPWVCAECGRAVIKTAPVMVGRVPFGRGCATRLGIIRPRGPSPPKAGPRPLDVAVHEVMDGQLDLLDELGQ